MAEGLDVRRDTPPFQLWDDLGCERLKDYLPIAQAAYEVRYKREQKRQGIVPLSECRLVAELPHA
jgi:hypothetical protein